MPSCGKCRPVDFYLTLYSDRQNTCQNKELDKKPAVCLLKAKIFWQNIIQYDKIALCVLLKSYREVSLMYFSHNLYADMEQYETARIIYKIESECNNQALFSDSIDFLIGLYDLKYEKSKNKPNITPISQELVESEKLTCKERHQMFITFLNETKDPIWKEIAAELNIKNNSNLLVTIKLGVSNVFNNQKKLDYLNCKYDDIKRLLIQGQDPTAVLFECVKNNPNNFNKKTYSLLKDNGANPYAIDKQGYTLLHYISMLSKHNSRLAKIFLNTIYAKVNILNENSLIKSNQELEHKGPHNVNATQNNISFGATPLYLACTNKTPNLEWIEALLNNNADPNSLVSVNKNKPLPILEHIFNMANQYNNEDTACNIVKLFLEWSLEKNPFQPENVRKLIFDKWVLKIPQCEQQKKIIEILPKDILENWRNIKLPLLKAVETFILCTKKRTTNNNPPTAINNVQKTKPVRNIILSYLFKEAGPIGEELLQEKNHLGVSGHFKPN